MARKPKEQGGMSVTLVKKSKAKQDDLPGVEVSDRRIQELEDLAEELQDWLDKTSEVKHRTQAAEDDLITAMRRRDKTYYNRPLWGSITLKQAAEKVKVKRAGAVSVNVDSEDVDNESAGEE